MWILRRGGVAPFDTDPAPRLYVVAGFILVAVDWIGLD